MNRIPVATFGTRSAAEPLQRRLADAGIQAEIHDELKLEKFWFASKEKSGSRLEVPADQFERAYHLLLDWDAADGALRDAVRCPECKSLRVQYPQFTRRSLIPNLVVGTLAAIGQIEKQYYCDDCHFTWPKQGTKHSVRRHNMAPYYFIDGVEQTSRAMERTEAEPARRAA
jgi:predicted Zn-ribbon and HTH transcriptional regulator